MKKVYVLLEWYYDGDSYLVNHFVGVFPTIEELKLSIKDGKCPLEGFINYKDPGRPTSPVYIEGWEPIDFPNQNEVRYEIREIVFKDYSDWNIENPESIECCKKCNMPVGKSVTSKVRPTTGYYICLCGWDASNVKKI